MVVVHSRVSRVASPVAGSAVVAARAVAVAVVAATAAAAAAAAALAVRVRVVAAAPSTRAQTRSWSPISRPATARS
jgi:hypothetical protein